MNFYIASRSLSDAGYSEEQVSQLIRLYALCNDGVLSLYDMKTGKLNKVNFWEWRNGVSTDIEAWRISCMVDCVQYVLPIDVALVCNDEACANEIRISMREIIDYELWMQVAAKFQNASLIRMFREVLKMCRPTKPLVTCLLQFTEDYGILGLTAIEEVALMHEDVVGTIEKWREVNYDALDMMTVALGEDD